MNFIKEFYNVNADAWLAPPEGVRLREGPRWSLNKRHWSRDHKFFRVTDLDTSEVFYLPSWEALNKVGVAYNTFKKRTKSRRPVIIKDRFKVEKIPKYLFIKKTGRKYDQQREYFYKY